MSQWTHVAGVLRFDALRGLGAFGAFPHPRTFMGTPSRWDDDLGASQALDIPAGSEGSLQLSFYEEPDRSSIAAYVATVFGDLRDYSDADAIVGYFTRVAKAGKLVRQAVFTVEVEGYPVRTWVWLRDQFVELTTPADDRLAKANPAPEQEGGG